jgi:hypothetical protein
VSHVYEHFDSRGTQGWQPGCILYFSLTAEQMGREAGTAGPFVMPPPRSYATPVAVTTPYTKELDPPRLPSRLASESEAAEIHSLKEELLKENSNNLPESINVAIARGTIDGKSIDLKANSSKKAGEGTIPHKLFKNQQLKTQPTANDLAKGRYHEAVRAYDSEIKILEKILDDTAPNSTGEITITSLNDFCTSCESVIDVQMMGLRPGIKINKVYVQPYKNK